MITEALQHCHGVGPVRLNQLRQSGVRSWHDVISDPKRIQCGLRDSVLNECLRCLEALERDDIGYFVNAFAPADRWRILSRYLDRVSYFDIETTGLEFDSTITVIICWHRNELHTFVEHENLDDFLDLLDEVDLLASFNGSSFDVPKLLDSFHIPELPCPHLDLRWPAHYRNLTGGLKHISARLGVSRPPDLTDADGELAVRLWYDWQNHQDTAAREQLIRYCAADVLLLRPLAGYLSGEEVPEVSDLWKHLPKGTVVPTETQSAKQRRRDLAARFGSASPAALRTLRRRT